MGAVMICPLCSEEIVLPTVVGPIPDDVLLSHVWLTHMVSSGQFTKTCWCGAIIFDHDFDRHLKKRGGLTLHFLQCQLGVYKPKTRPYPWGEED